MSNAATKIQSVLLVDDDDNIRLIAQMSLEGLTDWEISEARNGKEALAILATKRPDLLLFDVMMPDMTGIDLLSKTKELLGEQLPPVIFMTAKVQVSEIEKYIAIGAAGVIMKPFDPMTLPEQIQTVLTQMD
ncbi:MAG TPA: response regulator [Drouetiella sp.]